jgi:hypothetical protein
MRVVDVYALKAFSVLIGVVVARIVPSSMQARFANF